MHAAVYMYVKRRTPEESYHLKRISIYLNEVSATFNVTGVSRFTIAPIQLQICYSFCTRQGLVIRVVLITDESCRCGCEVGSVIWLLVLWLLVQEPKIINYLMVLGSSYYQFGNNGRNYYGEYINIYSFTFLSICEYHLVQFYQLNMREYYLFMSRTTKKGKQKQQNAKIKVINEIKIFPVSRSHK